MAHRHRWLVIRLVIQQAHEALFDTQTPHICSKLFKAIVLWSSKLALQVGSTPIRRSVRSASHRYKTAIVEFDKMYPCREVEITTDSSNFAGKLGRNSNICDESWRDTMSC